MVHFRSGGNVLICYYMLIDDNMKSSEALELNAWDDDEATQATCIRLNFEINSKKIQGCTHISIGHMRGKA